VAVRRRKGKNGGGGVALPYNKVKLLLSPHTADIEVGGNKEGDSLRGTSVACIAIHQNVIH